MSRPYYYGQGRVYLSPLGNSQLDWRWIGDVSELQIDLSFDERVKKSSINGRLITTKKHITAVSAGVSMVIHEMSHDNLSLIFNASKTKNKQGNQSETHRDIKAGDIITLKRHNVRNVDITGLKEVSDYIVNEAFGSIEFITVPTQQTALITYDYPEEVNLSIFNAQTSEYALRYEGVNLANSNESTHIELYRLSFDLSAVFTLINGGNELLGIELNAQLLPDMQKLASAELGLFGAFTASSKYKVITYDSSISYEGHHQHVY